MRFHFKTGMVVVIVCILIVLGLLFVQETRQDEQLKVVTTYSIVHDLVENVAGDRVELDTMVPIGEEPEEYEPLPEDMTAVSEADLVFANGLGIESWLERIIQNVASNQTIIEVIEGVEPFHLYEGGLQGEPDPHAWFDPILVRDYYIPNILDALIELDPEGEEYYQQRAEEYQKQLGELDQWIKEQVEQIPAENRVLVTSEGAYRYFVEAYGFEEGFIWQINSHEEGTPQQIADLIDSIKDQKVKAVFVETSVSHRPMERVAEEVGVPIGGVLYSDSTDEPGSENDNYLSIMEHNVTTIVEALGGSK
ncbi:zinc ABC transporter substrate-binding protein [Natroniella sulfidigena]|uniref:metal ABC transporter solute-binding protein, Zn/Mn family n=1 Tax=Natroniella sulfidigena TaxID=723921 RepID=UPI00200B4A3F|nr:zinc ABC transporter substrate-binding protein [Natroniella sulfidigena]MCK8815995.1 zinc ABC transporter substrate-binding protein [Natroniella sulfidigena]